LAEQQETGIHLEGWAGLEPGVPVDAREAEQKREDLDRLVARVFGNAEGKKLLGWMRQVYVEPPVFTPGAGPDWGYYFEGRRFVVQDLETRLIRATKPQEPTDGRGRKRSRRSNTGSQDSNT